MKLAMESSLVAGDSRSDEHSGDSPDKKPEESSSQSRWESMKQSEEEIDMIGADYPSFSSGHRDPHPVQESSRRRRRSRRIWVEEKNSWGVRECNGDEEEEEEDYFG